MAVHDPSQRGSGAIAAWLAASAMWCVLLIGLVLTVPVRFRPVGLFLVLFGLVAGWGMGALARRFRIAPSRAHTWLATLLAAGALGGLLIGSYRQHTWAVSQEIARAKQALKESIENDPAAKFDAQFHADKDRPRLDAESEERRKQFTSELDRIRELRYKRLSDLDVEGTQNQAFSAYLKHRVASLGNWDAPWPYLFVTGELIAGCLAGVWLAIRTTTTAGTVAPGEKTNSGDGKQPVGDPHHE